MELRPWHGCRERHLAKLTHAEATDIILHCKTPADDAVYAARYGLTGDYVRKIRCGAA